MVDSEAALRTCVGLSSGLVDWCDEARTVLTGKCLDGLAGAGVVKSDCCWNGCCCSLRGDDGGYCRDGELGY